MKKLTLLVATGQTDSQFLQQAIEKGFTVRCLVRDPSKLKTQHARVEVIQGDVLDYKAVQKLVTGVDVVVSLFGQVKGSPHNVQTEGTRHILLAMEAAGVNRIISLSGGGLPFPEKDRPKFPDRMIRRIMEWFVPHVLKDAEGQAQLLRESRLKWSIARGPRLTNGPHTGQYRVGWVGVNSGMSLSRADLAEFILKEVEEERFNYQMPFVSY